MSFITKAAASRNMSVEALNEVRTLQHLNELNTTAELYIELFCNGSFMAVMRRFVRRSILNHSILQGHFLLNQCRSLKDVCGLADKHSALV